MLSVLSVGDAIDAGMAALSDGTGVMMGVGAITGVGVMKVEDK